MVLRIMPYKILAFGLTDIGLVRQNNEDVWAEVPSLRFFVLADGMGGHQAGEIAAREAANALCKDIKKRFDQMHGDVSIREAHDAIREAIQHTNSVVYRMSRSDIDLRGMGTTLCCLKFHEKGLVYAHVGDSRIYRLRDQKLVQLTQDHSLLRELVDMGQLNEQQATDFLYKNIITKAIGTESSVDPSVHVTEVTPGDVFLMCSDGLSDLLTRKDIETVLMKSPTLKDAAMKLVSDAKEKGGYDNVTVVMAKVESIDETKDLSR